MRRSDFARPAAAALFLFCFLAPMAAQNGGLQTNALSGVFQADRRFWFSVPDGQRLRLLVNGNESYRGPGPSSSTFTARPGEDRSYELVAERRSAPPEDALLESRSFSVRIDASPPAPVSVAGSQDRNAGSPWTLRFSAEEGSRVFAVVDADSYVAEHSDLRGSAAFSARRVEGLAWCVDAAGNVSAPSPFSFKPFSLSVVNPEPGTWANEQLLVLESEGASEIFWSVDGGDPLESGRPYLGPTLIERTGTTTVRVAARSPDGRVERAEQTYRVEPATLRLSAVRALEAAPVVAETVVSLPPGLRWDIGVDGRASASSGSFAFPSDRPAVLRPIEGVRRYVPFFVDAGKGTQRYLFSLGVQSSEPAAVPPAAAAPGADLPSAPSVLSAGRARIAFWDRRAGSVRYRWSGKTTWTDASAPVSVAAEGGVLEWLIDKGSSIEGPYSKTFPAVVPEASYPSAVPVVSSHAAIAAGSVSLTVPAGADGIRFSLSAPAAGIGSRTVELPGGSSLTIDVCDGEQIAWTAAGEGSTVSGMVDRRPPAAPSLEAPAEGAWERDVPLVSFRSSEGRLEAIAQWRDEDGRSGSYPLEASARLRSFRGGPVEYRIEARVVDEAGNIGESVVRRFTVDESTVYASDAGIAGDGSRARPFLSLADAISLARSHGRSRVWISGRVTLQGRAELFDGLSVEGGYGPDWRKTGARSEVLFAQDSSFSAKSGASTIRDLVLKESGSRGVPLLTAADGAALELTNVSIVPGRASRIAAPAVSLRAKASLKAKGSDFLGGSPVLESIDSSIALAECLVSATAERGGRSTALRSRESSIRLELVRIEAGADRPGAEPAAVAIGADLTGGTLRLIRSVVSAAAADSASALVVRGAAVDAADSEFRSVADRYASAFSLEDGSAELSRGRLSATARDAVALMLNAASPVRIDAARFEVAGSGVVRAVQVRGSFPQLTGCVFSASGGASGAEAFAGDPPSSGSVRGNRFSGFSYLYDRSIDANSLALFNRRFAGRGPANEIGDAGGM